MFRGQRQRVRILFGTADVFLIALAFALAYAIRSRLNLENNFYIPQGVAASLLVWSMVVRTGRTVTKSDRFARVVNRLGGTILIALGVKTAAT